MGDRANAYLVDTDDERHGIYYYTHWSGEVWPEQIRRALEFGKGRWDDPQYLARIIASRVFAELVDEETGGGISTVLHDNEHPILVVDLVGKQIAFAAEDDEQTRSKWTHVETFLRFVNRGSGGAHFPTHLGGQ